MKKLSSKKGFSLAEIIASVGIFLFIGVFVIQAFTISYDMSKKAAEKDRAAAFISSMAELWKGGGSPDRIASGDHVYELKDGENTFEVSDNLNIDDFMAKKAGSTYILSAVKTLRSDDIFTLELSLLKNESSEGKNENAEDNMIFSLTCGKYFGRDGE